MRSKSCSITVDLDPLRFYGQIHGLSDIATTHCPVYTTALERLSAWARSQSLPMTWFVVGEELESSTVVARLKTLHTQGDELSNHSEHHYYDLTKRSRVEMLNEVGTVSLRLAAITGERAFGFRAPGYRMTDELLTVLNETNVLYDSSVFPCPTYWAAKAVVLLGQRVLGRISRSLLDHPKVVMGPRLPYSMGRNYLSCGTGLLELPITVTPGLRLPFIGTSLSFVGQTAAMKLARSLTEQPFVNLELHGIDALDWNDGLGSLAKVQPDLRIAWQRKLETFTAAISVLRRSGFSFVTLREAASKLP
jgi:hypothetical protein